MNGAVAVAAGSALGAVLRFAAGTWVVEGTAVGGFPWATLWINASGAFAIGVLAVWMGPGGRWREASSARLFLVTGLCGGYTTFSVFSLETLELLSGGAASVAAAYVGGTLVASLLAVWAGYVLALHCCRAGC